MNMAPQRRSSAGNTMPFATRAYGSTYDGLWQS